MERQKGIFGSETMPPAKHPADIVECQDMLGLDRYQERQDCWEVEIPSFVPSQQIRGEIESGKHDAKEITFVDSLKAGNCKDGTIDWIKKNGLPDFSEDNQGDKKSRIGVVRRLAENQDSYSVKRYIYQAMVVAVRRQLEDICQPAEYYYHYDNYRERLEELADDIAEHNSEIFNQFFREAEQWVDDYVRSDDYAADYCYLMSEDSYNIVERISDMLPDDTGLRSYRLPKQFVADVTDYILDNDCFETEISGEYDYTPSRYLDGFQIGEYEEQIEVDRIREYFEQQGGHGDFEDQFSSWCEDQLDYCVRSFGSADSTIYLIVNTGLRIDWYTTEDQLAEATTAVVLDYCRRQDRARFVADFQYRLPRGK